MSQDRTVAPNTKRITLSDGDWIDVIEEMNAGEYYDMIDAFGQRDESGKRKLFPKLLAYIVAWSLHGNGQPLPWRGDDGQLLPEDERRAVLRSLNKGTIRELTAKVDRHELEEEAAIDAKKKAPADAPASSPTSPSVAS